MSDNLDEKVKELSTTAKKIKDQVWESISSRPTIRAEIEFQIEVWTAKNQKLSQKLKYFRNLLFFICGIILLAGFVFHWCTRGWGVKIMENLIDDSNSLLKMFITVISSRDNKKCAILCTTLIAIIFIKSKYNKK